MKEFTLPNGMRCILQNNKCHQSVTVTIMFRVGSRDEPRNYYGLTHFAEHMFFKGTKKRPKAEMISKAIDRYGGQVNAVTDYDVTFYYIKIDRNHLDVALDVLSDMLFNSLFESKEIKSEKEVVVEELHIYRSNPSRHINTISKKSIFKGTTLEHDIGGDPTTVRAATREKFLAFLSHFYHPENAVISIVGNLPTSETRMKSRIKLHFNHKFTYLPSKTLKKYDYQTFEVRKLFPDFHQMQKSTRFCSQVFPEMKNTYLMIGFPAFRYRSTAYYIALMITSILSGGMSSRLFLEVREKRGLVYKIKADLDAYEDLGAFTIVAATSSKVNRVVKVVLGELKKIKDGKITAKEIQKARDYLVGSELIRRESSNYLAETAAYDKIVFGRIINPDEYFEKLAGITKKDIRDIAEKMFVLEKMNLCLISKSKFTKKQILGKIKSI